MSSSTSVDLYSEYKPPGSAVSRIAGHVKLTVVPPLASTVAVVSASSQVHAVADPSTALVSQTRTA